MVAFSSGQFPSCSLYTKQRDNRGPHISSSYRSSSSASTWSGGGGWTRTWTLRVATCSIGSSQSCQEDGDTHPTRVVCTQGSTHFDQKHSNGDRLFDDLDNEYRRLLDILSTIRSSNSPYWTHLFPIWSTSGRAYRSNWFDSRPTLYRKCVIVDEMIIGTKWSM